jgi:hypothetical protein
MFIAGMLVSIGLLVFVCYHEGDKEDVMMLLVGVLCVFQLLYVLQVALTEEYYLDGACYVSASTPLLDTIIQCECRMHLNHDV